MSRDALCSVFSSRHLFDAVCEMAGDGMAVIANERVVHCNTRLADMLSAGTSLIVGAPLRELVLTPVDETLRAAGQQGRVVRTSWDCRCAGGPVRRLSVTVQRVVVTGHNETVFTAVFQNPSQHDEADATASSENEMFQTLVEQTTDAFYLCDEEARIERVNSRACECLAYSREELTNLRLYDVDALYDNRRAMRRFLEQIRPGKPVHIEGGHRKKDGSIIPIEASVAAFRHNGRLYYLITARDVSERKQIEERHRELEEQLTVAQRMESVGRLAGGVAHDFNNLLQVISGYTDLAKMISHPDSELHEPLTEIDKAAERAAALVRQLLAFSRNHALNTRPLSLNELVERTGKMVRRLVGELVEVTMDLTDESTTILADAGQIEQLLLNIAVHAHNAMAEGGVMRIRTAARTIGEDATASAAGTAPGPYLLLSVAYSGKKPSPELRNRAFDPVFFTGTSEPDTGFGPATAYAIAQRHNGFIEIKDYDVGRMDAGKVGTEFRVYLPRYPTPDAPAGPPGIADQFPPESSRKTVLLAEDDHQVRRLATLILNSIGCSVIEVADGEQAITAINDRASEIDLVVLDLVMPKKSGRAVYEVLRQVNPEVPVLFTSGYNADVLAAEDYSEELFIVPKPFKPAEFLQKVVELLSKG